MNCAHSIGTITTVLLLTSASLADTFQDNFFVDLDPSQITEESEPVSGYAWTQTNLQMTNAWLVLMGDDYIGNIDFLNDELLSLTGFQGVELELRAQPAAYTIDFYIIGETESGDTTLL
ncbi:MAG: hypothetical protein JSW71_08310, partial [Gemmatimonadota bacterium]